MKYAHLGYTYQHYLACLMLAMMDTERQIQRMRLEFKADHQFDDIAIEAGGQDYFLQIKDFDQVELSDLQVTPDAILIKKVPHKLSCGVNIVFFKQIALKCKDKVLGFKAEKIDGVYLVSLSRAQVAARMTSLYKDDLHRRQVIEHFFSIKLDARILDVKREELPSIVVFDTRLVEKTVRVSRKILDFADLLHIEGKPGVGKSHLVSYLQKLYPTNVLYRFWISNQDRQYESRLRYADFISNLIRQVFLDQKPRSETEILQKLQSDKVTFILDGLDHVENYRSADLEKFIEFVELARIYTKVIVLSRPLKRQLHWKKQVLGNWNKVQTDKVLKERFHLEGYDISCGVYQLTDGYPILVKYVAEQYKKDGFIPAFPALASVNEYYNKLFERENGKQALGLFLCCRGYIMDTEIRLFLGEIAGSMLEEIIRERPYLFEIKLNRISLYHDSLITFLRNSGVEITAARGQVNKIVYQSLMNGDSRFQSRLIHFDLPGDDLLRVISRYSSIRTFRDNLIGVVDYEAVMAFYEQIRRLLPELHAEDFTIGQLYDLVLIFNLTGRDHLSTRSDFYDTYLTLLKRQGYTAEHITSDRYMFGMLVYQETLDGSFLNGIMADSNYDTKRFYQELESKVGKERDYFHDQDGPFRKQWIDIELRNRENLYLKDTLQEIFVNVYLHELQHDLYPEILDAVQKEMEGDRYQARRILYRYLSHLNWSDREFHWLLEGVKKELYARGVFPDLNRYVQLSLADFLAYYSGSGSFDLTEKLQDYLRLALHQNRTIDIASIAAFWTKYYNRKDYTLYGLSQALPAFERLGLIQWQDAVQLITHVQEISEKGYRGLLQEYIEEHDASFILALLDEFGLEELQISWFLLKPQFLDVLPDYVYNYECYQQFQYHRHSREIDVYEVEQVLLSNKSEQLCADLKRAGMSVSLKKGDARVGLLESLGVEYVLHEDRYSHRESTGQERFEQGILDKKNQEMIPIHGMSAAEVARYGDGYYTALADPAIYKHFRPEEIRANMKQIIYNALIGTSAFSGSFNATWLMPGTVIKLMAEAGMDAEIETLFESMVAYLHLSGFPLDTGEAVED